MKKWMVMMLTVFLVLTYMPLAQAGVACETGIPDGDFCYIVNDDNLTVTITGYTGTGGVLEIPGTIDGNTVTVIGYSAFMSNQLTSVTIPDSVQTIGVNAFANNQLTSVTLPDGVTELGSFALATNQLTSVTFPDSVTSIGARALYQNPLKTVVIDGNDEQGTTIGDYAIGSFSLTSVTLGEGVVSIGTQAFYPHQLTSVTIPGSVKSIGEGAFTGNPGGDSLTSVTLGEGIETIGDSAFIFNQLASVTIPASVTSIESSAFLGNRITSMTIPASVQTIGDQAFSSNKMEHILFEGSPILGTSVFAQTWGLYPEFVGWYTDPEFASTWDGTAVPTGKEAFAQRNPDSPTEVTAAAGDGQATVSFTAPSHTGKNAVTAYTVNVYVDGVEQQQTTGVASPITITGLMNGTAYTFAVIATNATGDSVESDATDAVTPLAIFETTENEDGTLTITKYNGTETELEIPDMIDGKTVTAIGFSAFSSKQLTSVTIPESVVTIGSSAFSFNQLTSVTFEDGVETIGPHAFSQNSLISVTIPESVTSVGTGAFAGNMSLESVNIYGNDDDELGTSIGTNAFGNTSLTSVTLGEGVTSIGDVAFQYNQLTSLTIPGTVTSIGSNAFKENSLKSLTIKEGVENIGSSAFSSNQLTSVTIPNSVKSVGVSAFSNNRLERITFEGTPTLAVNAFLHYYTGFEGWYTDASVTEEWTDQLSLPVSGELYARTTWPASPSNASAEAGDAQVIVSFTAPTYSGESEITGYTVKVYVDGVEQSGLKTTGDQSPITVTGLTNGTAYTFKVIASNAAGDSLESAASNAVTPVEEYNVTYDGNGNHTGSVPTDSNSYEQGSEVTVLDNAGNLEKTGQSFAGWNTASDGSGTLYEAGDTFNIGNVGVTLYAVWKSSHAELNGLSISDGTLTPGFSSQKTSYTVDVAYEVSSVTVTAAVYDSHSTLKVNGTSVTSGSASSALSLDEGNNTITVEVTAQNGTAKEYTIVVNRAAAPSTNSDLNALSISEGTLTPSFSPGTTSYTVDVVYDVSSVTVTAAVYDSSAALRVNGSSVTSGSASSALALVEGENTITVVVTAEDGTTRNYTIVVNRAADDRDDRHSGNGNTGNNQTTTEEITVEVESGNDGTTVSTTTIKRTKDNEGRIKDEVVLSENSAKETIQKLRAQEDDTASIVIPDTKDEVSEVHVIIPKTALNKLKEGNINLEIKTANAKLAIPASTLTQFDEDIYFRVVPIKDQTEKEQVEERVKLEKMIQEVAANKEIQILGRPAVIETNMQNQIVLVTMPLQSEDLSLHEQERQKVFNNLAVFVEHSDGTKELVSSEVTANADGTWDIAFEIDKFSTFSMVHLEGAEQYFAQSEEPMMHQAYIAGYADGTFRPDQHVTRAEMASLLARNLTTKASEHTEFTDLVDTHWAYDSIQQVVAAGLMKGYPGEVFKPDAIMTRAEMAAIVLQWNDLQASNESQVFMDTENHWAAGIIAAVSHDNVMNGYPDGSFKPDQTLSRAEAVTVINSLLERGPLHGVEKNIWPDVPTTHWAYPAIQEASMSHSFEIAEGVESFVEEVE